MDILRMVIDPAMRRLMENAPMIYRITKNVEFLTQPITGNKSGEWSQIGKTFESSTTSQGGWIKYADKRWMPDHACVLVTAPPVDEPDVPPVVDSVSMTIHINIVDNIAQSVTVNGEQWHK
jgi:hypothetical protein